MPIRSTNGSRPGRGGAAIADWLDLQAPGAEGESRPVYVDGEICRARCSSGTWSLAAPSAPAQAFAAAHPMPPGAALPLLADYTWIAPGGCMAMQALGENAGFVFALQPGDGSYGFAELEITLHSTLGASYPLRYLSVGPLNGTAETGNYATGYVNVVNSPVMVPGGTPSAPGFLTFTVNVPTGSGAFAVVCELGNGGEVSTWTQAYQDVDFDQTLLSREARMNVLPSSGTFNVTSTGSTFTLYPNMSVKVKRLTKPMATILMPGDSHAGAYSNASGEYNDRRGIPYELSLLAEADGVPVTFCPLGYDGLTTTQIAQRFSALLAGPFAGARTAWMEAFSINNFAAGLSLAQAQTDYLAMEQAMYPQPTLGIFMGVKDDATAPQKQLQRDFIAWMRARQPEVLDDHYSYVVNETTLTYIAPYGAPDQAHMTTEGYYETARRNWPAGKAWLVANGVAAP